MARGDCESAFQAAAAADGIVLVRARVPWINQRGHLGLPEQAAPVLPVLDEIFKTLGGIEPEQAAKKAMVLPGDFLHVESGVFIETDEEQHFTSHRLVTLSLYPNDVPLGFDLDGYKRLCETRAHKADRYRASKPAIGFGPGGRQRQRAFNDALRDLVTPLMGHPPLIRVPAPDRDGAAAYAAVRDRLRAAVGL